LLEYVAAGQACVILDKLSPRGYELMQQRATKKTVFFDLVAPATAYSIGILTPLHLPISLVEEDFYITGSNMYRLF
jgi:hypothetical protein